jgi:hypothetical protein
MLLSKTTKEHVMVKPRGKVTRSSTPKKATYLTIADPEIRIAAWCPDDEAKLPPEQVHLIFTVPNSTMLPLVLRYKSPDTLGFIIEELARYRREVWPDSEPVNLDP